MKGKMNWKKVKSLTETQALLIVQNDKDALPLNSAIFKKSKTI
jgi:hypothetical protein